MESDDRSLKQNVSEQLTGGHQQTADPVSWKITSNLSPSYINRVLSRKCCRAYLVLFVPIFLNGIKNHILCPLANQSTDSGHSNQSGATNEILRLEFSRA